MEEGLEAAIESDIMPNAGMLVFVVLCTYVCWELRPVLGHLEDGRCLDVIYHHL